MDVTQLALTWVGWLNGEKLALTGVQSERKSSQVNASARKPWPNGVASRPKFLRLRVLTSPFGQGFTLIRISSVRKRRKNTRQETEERVKS